MRLSPLHFAVRPRVIAKYFGLFCLILAGLSCFPLVLSIFHQEFYITFRYVVVALLVGAIGFFLNRLPPPREMQANEAMVLTSIIFIFASFVMCFPLMGSGLSFMDALFEAVSASTTTGLSALNTVEDKPDTFLFARAWMQWYGGLGIVILALTIMPGPGKITRELAVTEGYEDDLVGGSKSHAKYVLFVYVGITLISALLLIILGCGLRDSVLITFCAVSTGGFSPYDISLANFTNFHVQLVITFICLAGAISFVFYRGLYFDYRKAAQSDIQTRWILIMCLVMTMVISATMVFYDEIPVKLAMKHGVFMAFSAQTTTGFSTLSVSALSEPTKLFLIISMAVGGGLGSTAGGIKLIRILILFKLCSYMIKKACMPKHAISSVTLSGRRVDPEEVNGAALITFLFLGCVIVSWSAFTLMGYDPLDSLFEVVSATGTVGLSTGVVAPDLPAFLKGLLCVNMIMGRLEILALLALLYPGTWIGRRRRIQ
jgi:trk system potassium uptake protein TrkH